MRKFTSFFATMLLTALAARGATVNWSAQINTGLIDSSSSALAQGNWLLIGYFGTLSDAQVANDALTLSGISTLQGDFHLFASTTVGTGTSAAASFSLSSAPLYSSLSGFTPSSQIYFWALKSTNNTSLSTALSTATQTAIGYVPFANLSTWQFPAADASAAKTIDISDLANANRQILAGSYVSGNTAALTSTFGTPNHALQLANVSTVPEPSTYALLGTGLLTSFTLLRRRKMA
jgi:hypothetical protein